MVKVYIVDGGTFIQDQSIATFAVGIGQPMTCQVYSVYVDHSEAMIVPSLITCIRLHISATNGILCSTIRKDLPYSWLKPLITSRAD
jgi:hypothetical protein